MIDREIVEAINAILTGNPKRGPHVNVGSSLVRPIMSPDDVKTIVGASVTALATGGGGQEVKFNDEGIIVPGSGSAGIYWSRANREKWAAIVGGRLIPFDPTSGFFVGSSTGATGQAPGGVLSLEFYIKPANVTWADWRDWVELWTRGMQGGAAGGSSSGSGLPNGTAASTLIAPKGYDGATYDPTVVPGSPGPRQVFIGLDTNTPPGTNDPAAVFCLADTQAKSQAGNGVIMLPGGNYVWPGGPAYICEIANLGSAAAQVVTVLIPS